MFQWRRVVLPAALFLAACSGPPDGFTDTEWTAVQALSPLPAVPADPTNKYADNEAAARLGQTLFFEKRFSGPITVADDGTNGGLGQAGELGKVSCADCHLPSFHYCDNRSIPNNLSLGANRGKRNSPSMIDVAYYDWFTWAGRLDSLWTQGASAPESPDMSSNRCRVAHYLWDNQRAAYDAVFDTPLPTALDPAAADAARFPANCKPKAAGAADGAWEAMAADDRTAILQIMANVGKALAAYERRLVSGPAPFDQYVAGNKDALSASAKRGLKVFIGKGFCVQCHSGPTFTDQKFHNLGVPQTGENVPATDTGRFDDIAPMLANPFSSSKQFSDAPDVGLAKVTGIAPTEADKGAFRTKNLRGVAESTPYFHTGGFATLEEVVDFYDQGGGDTGFSGTKDEKIKPLHLSAAEKADLVAFLQALSGAEPPSDWGQPN